MRQMKNYVLYIDCQFYTYNVVNINDDELKVFLDAYKYAKPSYYVSGKKYNFDHLLELKIYEINDIHSFNNWLNDFHKNDDNETNILTPKILRSIGNEVTRLHIKDDYGFGNITSKTEGYSINKEMDIFISHSSTDAIITEHLINIIRKALNIDSSKIRCTSVEGYKLPTGASTDEQLKREIHLSKVFIALITKTSINSAYVLFEIGARWGIGEPLLPLICDVAGASLLEGPLKNINALNATNSSDILQFIEDLGKHLNLKPEPASLYIKEVNNLNKTITGSKNSKNSFLTENSEFDDSDSIIKKRSLAEWPDDYAMQVNEIIRQKKAVENLRKGRPNDLTDEEFFKIRERAKKEWPYDFVMQENEEKRQIDSLRKLKSM